MVVVVGTLEADIMVVVEGSESSLNVVFDGCDIPACSGSNVTLDGLDTPLCSCSNVTLDGSNMEN